MRAAKLNKNTKLAKDPVKSDKQGKKLVKKKTKREQPPTEQELRDSGEYLPQSNAKASSLLCSKHSSQDVLKATVNEGK